MCWESRDLFKFREMSYNKLLTVQDRSIVTMDTDRKSDVAYRIAPLLMPLTDLGAELHAGPNFKIRPDPAQENGDPTRADPTR